ncbi:hypothetical protein GCM10010387_07490 [Streptomyces inusitatus]|uniref:Secreted protein n=1 Tax=Streptomyces inusitatus TaxID=68221 RepID=A0A918PQ10_9ACTN|nr:hypothetical protein [Streptomyces inusitatus]GGZ17301.1 hypothetical protein GCM10010387_07490 [Streptomyces inusitatus]
MRQSKTLKRAAIVGATALLGVSAAIGAAQANGADSSDTSEPKSATTVQHPDKGVGPSTESVDKDPGWDPGKAADRPGKVTSKHAFGDASAFCFVPADGELPTGAALPSGGADGKPEICFESAEDDKPGDPFEPAGPGAFEQKK